MLELHIANGCGPTGRLLQRLLQQHNVRFGAGGGVVSWGVRLTPGPRILNARAGGDKFVQLTRLLAQRVLLPPLFETPPYDTAGQYPVLARKRQHMGGRDIQLCLQMSDAIHWHERGYAFFTGYIPRRTEYRVWIYRQRHLGTYEKVLTRPELYGRRGRIGCNHANGFAFRLLQEDAVPRDAVELACHAIEAMGLDFGAVDILRGIDTRNYVLEVNTAPGVEGEDRQVIRALARKIARWDELGFPRRNGDQP